MISYMRLIAPLAVISIFLTSCATISHRTKDQANTGNKEEKSSPSMEVHIYAPDGTQISSSRIENTNSIILNIELDQKQSFIQAPVSQNLTPASRPDDFGDVDVPSPPQDPEMDQRSLFPGMAAQDTSVQAPHSAREGSDTYKAGQPDGNTNKSNTAGTSNVHLTGRSVVGNLPRPTYNVQREGKVVVSITVDQYGNVTQAVPGAEGTTVKDKSLWAAARKAAMESHFNKSNDPVPSQGTITYEFKLK